MGDERLERYTLLKHLASGSHFLPPSRRSEPPIAQLADPTVSTIAPARSCESGTEIHGEIAITFQIDATGRVLKSQMSSSIKNPKISGCILRSLQSWQFPKPPSGAAKGVYSVVYQ